MTSEVSGLVRKAPHVSGDSGFSRPGQFSSDQNCEKRQEPNEAQEESYSNCRVHVAYPRNTGDVLKGLTFQINQCFMILPNRNAWCQAADANEHQPDVAREVLASVTSCLVEVLKELHNGKSKGNQ